MHDEPQARTPPIVEQLSWLSEQADKRSTQKMEALINEYINRVARFLGIHHYPDRPKPQAAFERSERGLDLMVKSAEMSGLTEWGNTVRVLHINLVENFDKYALPIRHSLDTPKPGEPAMESIPLSPQDQDILDRLNSRRTD